MRRARDSCRPTGAESLAGRGDDEERAQIQHVHVEPSQLSEALEEEEVRGRTKGNIYIYHLNACSAFFLCCAVGLARAVAASGLVLLLLCCTVPRPLEHSHRRLDLRPFVTHLCRPRAMSASDDLDVDALVAELDDLLHSPAGKSKSNGGPHAQSQSGADKMSLRIA